METYSKSALIGVAGIAAVALICAGVIFGARHSPSPQAASQNGSTTAPSIGVRVQGTGSYTVTELPSEIIPVPPNYSTPLVFSPSVGADVRAALIAQFAQIRKTLARNVSDFDSWIDLGTVRKIGGDFEGAAVDWRYAAKLFPKSTVPFDNLGDLYMNFLKNYRLAEADFKQAIGNDKTDVNAYESLFSLYTTYGYASPADGIALLKQGAAANPTNPAFDLMLARYYRSVQDTADAKASYEAALKITQASGNQQLSAQIQEEAASQ